MVVRDLLAQVSTSECNTLGNRVQAVLLGAELLSSAVTEPESTSVTVEDLLGCVTTMNETLADLRAQLLEWAEC
jgi:hypothetical protein